MLRRRRAYRQSCRLCRRRSVCVVKVVFGVTVCRRCCRLECVSSTTSKTNYDVNDTLTSCTQMATTTTHSRRCSRRRCHISDDAVTTTSTDMTRTTHTQATRHTSTTSSQNDDLHTMSPPTSMTTSTKHTHTHTDDVDDTRRCRRRRCHTGDDAVTTTWRRLAR
jgi:hypothetical protein